MTLLIQRSAKALVVSKSTAIAELVIANAQLKYINP